MAPPERRDHAAERSRESKSRTRLVVYRQNSWGGEGVGWPEFVTPRPDPSPTGAEQVVYVATEIATERGEISRDRNGRGTPRISKSVYQTGRSNTPSDGS